MTTLTTSRSMALALLTAVLTGASVEAQARPAQVDTVQVAPPTGERESDRTSILTALERARPGDAVLFAPGTYLLGEIIRVETPRITLLGHPDGTVLRGCDPDEYAAHEREAIAAQVVGIALQRGRGNRIVGNSISDVARRDPFPGNTVVSSSELWREANGSAIWISSDSEDNQIADNIYAHIAGDTLVRGGVLQEGRAPNPADTLRYQVVNHGRHAGSMEVVTVADTIVVHVDRWDRTRETNTTTKYVTNAAGLIVHLEVHSGDASDPVERFALADGTARWRARVDSGTASLDGPAFYWPRLYNEYTAARLAAFLLTQPQKTADLLPFDAAASAHVAVDTVVAVDGKAERVRLVVMEMPAFAPYLVWLDARGELFASDAAWLTTVRAGAESALPVLRSLEREVLAERSEAVARRLTKPRTGPLVIRNGNLFDSGTATIRTGTTVVVEGERVTAVGAEGTVPVPAGATIIDASGKTVLPGLWDMHGHIDGWRWGRNEVGGILSLANGITTIRDLAADVDRAVSFRDRAAAGTLISPRILLAGFMDGPGRQAGPTEAIVTTEDEAIEWVARYDSLGYRQIKVYNLVHPMVVATIAEEAKMRGMRLSGHVPRGLSVTDVVRLGFDEIQHVSFLRRLFLPDSLRSQLQQGERLTPAERMASLSAMDIDGPEATRLIELLRDHGTVIDGTLNLSQDRGTALADGTDPLFGPTLDWLPSIARRRYTVAPTPAPPASRLLQAKYHRFLKRLYDAGVTIVPGTDNTAFAYVGELEIYERTGVPAPEVLRIATIVPAQVMDEADDYGSIEPGKVADIIIVDGDPSMRIQDLRKIETVVRAGRVYSIADLHAEVGVTPRW